MSDSVSPSQQAAVMAALTKIEQLFYELRSDGSDVRKTVDELISAAEGAARAFAGLPDDADLGHGITVARMRKLILNTRTAAINVLEEDRPELWTTLAGMRLA